MREGIARADETARREGLETLLRWRHRKDLPVEGEDQDALEAPDVDQVEAERPGTGGLEPRRGVAVGQAQQLLALAQLRPEERPTQESFGEVPDVRTGADRVPGPGR